MASLTIQNSDSLMIAIMIITGITIMVHGETMSSRTRLDSAAQASMMQKRKLIAPLNKGTATLAIVGNVKSNWKLTRTNTAN